MTSKLYKLEEGLAMAFFAGTCFMVFLGAVSRTVGSPLIWSVDVAQLLFAWSCALGADIALKHGNHVVIDIFTRRLPEKLQVFLAVLWQVLILVFLGLLIWFGMKLTLLNTQRSLGDVGISYAWVTVTVPVGAALMAITTLGRLCRCAMGQERILIQGHDGDAI
ncbi:MAG: TRAP transporter small permease [Moraxellaceae bacterium]|nr:TRAP transporter small permease [Moraxellaceae bacterium]